MATLLAGGEATGKISGASSAVGGNTVARSRSNLSNLRALPEKMKSSVLAAYQHKRKAMAKWLPIVLNRFRGDINSAKSTFGTEVSSKNGGGLLGLRGLSVPYPSPFENSKSTARASFADLFTLSEDYNNRDNIDIDRYDGEASVNSTTTRRRVSSASLNCEFSKFSSLAILYAEMYYHDDLTLDVEPEISGPYFWNDKQSVVIVTADAIYVFGSVGNVKAPTIEEQSFCAIASESDKDNRGEEPQQKREPLNCYTGRKFFEGYYLRRCVPIAAVTDFCLASVSNVVYVSANHDKTQPASKETAGGRASSLEHGRYYDLALPAITDAINHQHISDDNQDEPGHDVSVPDSDVLLEALAGAKKFSRWKIEFAKFTEEHGTAATTTNDGPSLAASFNGRNRAASSAPPQSLTIDNSGWDTIVKNAQNFTDRLKYRLTSQYAANGVFSVGNIPSTTASTVGGATATLSAKSSVRVSASSLSTAAEVQTYWNTRLSKLSVNGPSLADIPFRSQFHIEEQSVVLPPQPQQQVGAQPSGKSPSTSVSASSPVSKSGGVGFPSPSTPPITPNFSMNVEPLIPITTYNDITCVAMSVRLCRDLTQTQLGIAVAASRGFGVTQVATPKALTIAAVASGTSISGENLERTSSVTFAGDEALRRELALMTENVKLLEAEKNEIIRSSRGSFISNVSNEEMEKSKRLVQELQKQIRELEKESSDLQADNERIKNQLSLATQSVARQNKNIQTFVDDFVDDIESHWAKSIGYMFKFRLLVKEGIEHQLKKLIGEKNFANRNLTSSITLSYPAEDLSRLLMASPAINDCWSDLNKENKSCREKLKTMLREADHLPLVEIDGLNEDNIQSLTAQASFVTAPPKSGSSDFSDQEIIERMTRKYAEIKDSLADASQLISDLNDQHRRSLEKELFSRSYFSMVSSTQEYVLRNNYFTSWLRYTALRREIKSEILHRQNSENLNNALQEKIEFVQKKFDAARAEIGVLEDENDKLRSELEQESARLAALKQNTDSLMDMHKDMAQEMEVRVKKEQETEERLKTVLGECEEFRKKVGDLTKSLSDEKNDNQILRQKVEAIEKQLEGSLSAVEDIKKRSYAARTDAQKLELEHSKSFLTLLNDEHSEFTHSILVPALKNIQFLLITLQRNRTVNDQISEARTRTIQDQFIVVEGELGEAAKRILFLEESMDSQRKARDIEAEQFRAKLVAAHAESDKLRLELDVCDRKAQLLQRRVTELENDASERLESQKRTLGSLHAADLQVIEKQLQSQKMDMERLRQEFDEAMAERDDILAREAKLQAHFDQKAQELAATFDVIKDLEREMEKQGAALEQTTSQYTALQRSLNDEHEKIAKARADLDQEIESKRNAIEDERKRLNTRIFADAATEIDEQIMSPEAQRYEARIIDLQDDIRGLTHDLHLSAARENVLFNENATLKHDLAEAKSALDEAIEQMMEAEEDRSYMQVQVEKEKIALDEVAEWNQMTSEFFFHAKEKLLLEEVASYKSINAQLEEHIRGLVDEATLLTEDLASLNLKFEASENALNSATEQVTKLEEKLVEFDSIKETAETAAVFKEKWLEERTAHKALQEDKAAADEAFGLERRDLIEKKELEVDKLNAKIMELTLALTKAVEEEDANKVRLREELEVSRRQNLAANSQFQAQVAILSQEKTVSSRNISRLKRETALMRAVLQDYEISEDEYALEEDEENIESDDEEETIEPEEQRTHKNKLTAKRRLPQTDENRDSSSSPSPSRSATNTTTTVGDDFYRTGTSMTITTIDGQGANDNQGAHGSNTQYLRTRAKMAVVVAKGKSHKFLRGALLAIHLDRLMVWMKQWEESVFLGSSESSPILLTYLQERDELVVSSAKALLLEGQRQSVVNTMVYCDGLMGAFMNTQNESRKFFDDCQKELQNQRTEQVSIHHANELAKFASENCRLEDELSAITTDLMRKSTQLLEYQERHLTSTSSLKTLWEESCLARKRDVASFETESRTLMYRYFDQQTESLRSILSKHDTNLEDLIRERDLELAQLHETVKVREEQKIRTSEQQRKEEADERERKQLLHLQEQKMQFERQKEKEDAERREAEQLQIQETARREKELKDRAEALERAAKSREKEMELVERERQLREKELIAQQQYLSEQEELREEQRAQEEDRVRSREVLEMLLQQRQIAANNNFSRHASVVSVRNENQIITGPDTAEIERALFPPTGSGIMAPQQLVQLLLHMNNEKAKQIKISDTAAQIGEALKAHFEEIEARKNFLLSGHAHIPRGRSVSPSQIPPHAAILLGGEETALNNQESSEGVGGAATFARMMSAASSRNSYYRIASQQHNIFQRAASSSSALPQGLMNGTNSMTTTTASALINESAHSNHSNTSAPVLDQLATTPRVRSMSPNSSQHHNSSTIGRYATNNNIIPLSAITSVTSSPAAPSSVATPENHHHQQLKHQLLPRSSSVPVEPSPEQIRLSQRIAAVIMEEQQMNSDNASYPSLAPVVANTSATIIGTERDHQHSLMSGNVGSVNQRLSYSARSGSGNSVKLPSATGRLVTRHQLV